jgi:hypothetical protein
MMAERTLNNPCKHRGMVQRRPLATSPYRRRRTMPLLAVPTNKVSNVL